MAKTNVKFELKKRKPKLSEINELAMSVFIVNRKEEDRLKERLKFYGAELLSIMRGLGVSRNSIFQSFKVGCSEASVFFATARVEDVRDIIQNITDEFNLNISGNGKAFIIDIDGYLGAKALFID